MIMEKTLEIVEIKQPDACYVEPICRLLGQLSTSPVVFTQETLRDIAASPCCHLYLALCGGEVCGMLTLAHYLAPTGRKMWIEDVVVDSSHRGRSIGRRLVQHAIDCARSLGGTLMLTSRPTREAANALYRSIGFESKETNVYKMKL